MIEIREKLISLSSIMKSEEDSEVLKSLFLGGCAVSQVTIKKKFCTFEISPTKGKSIVFEAENNKDMK